MTVTETDNCVLFGDYTTSARCAGTDTLPYNALPLIIAHLNSLAHDKEFAKTIIVEGDRINNDTFFNALVKMPFRKTKLVLFVTSLEKSVKRLREAGSNITPVFVMGTRTKAMNNFIKYKKQFTIVEENYT